MRRAAILAGLVLAAGCGGGGEDGPPPDGRVIRAWIQSLHRGDYEAAASFFARGAIVDQGRPFRLRTHADAVEFNRSLPCRAEVTDVKDEGETTLATFALAPGPGGGGPTCDESVRVRFRLRDGRFIVWRQLPQAPAPEGDVA